MSRENPWCSAMSTSSDFLLLDSHNQLADTLVQIEISRIILCFTLGGWMWDVFSSLTEEHNILVSICVTMCDLYVISRLTTGATILVMLIFTTGPVNDCDVLANLKLSTWTGAFATSCNALIFFLRTHAVFFYHPKIRVLLVFLWCGTLGVYSLPFFIRGVPLFVTYYATSLVINMHSYAKTCVLQGPHVGSFSTFVYISTGPVMLMVHDTIMYLAVGVKLTKDRLAPAQQRRGVELERCLRAFFSGSEMGNLAKTLVVSGQVYYLITATTSVTTLLCVLSPSIPEIVRHSIPVHNIMIHNNMACKLYRRTKLGGITDGSPKFIDNWETGLLAKNS